jgi:hypothetical protein
MSDLVRGEGERRPRVFGLGLIKTGTSSLRRALEIIGYNSLHGGPLETMTLVQQAIDAGEPMLSRLDDDYDAFADVFGVTHYFYLADVEYPGSRFILTVRDLDEWLESRRRHVVKNQQMKTAGKYRGDLLEVDLESWATEYRRHEAVVRAYFSDRPDDLLIFNVVREGWEPLCSFLGRPVPQVPFPWVNEYRPWPQTA